MRKNFLTTGLIFAAFLLMNCNSVTSKAVESQMTIKAAKLLEPAREKTIFSQSGGKVDFKGVSFTYNRQIFGAVKTEEIAELPLENEDYKPDGVEPQHRLFTFDLSTENSEMYLAVYPVEDFPRMYAVSKESAEYMKQEINDLKKVLKDKNFRVENEIPFLRFYDATQTFQQKVKHLPFIGGKGILFLTFWQTELELPSNRQLRYVYQGLTADEKYYVLAEMPVSVDFLSKDSTTEYEGHKIPEGKEFNAENVMKSVAEVNKKVAKRLENTPQNKFSPNLKYFEEIISSLKIEK